jgi:hypothetical protein
LQDFVPPNQWVVKAWISLFIRHDKLGFSEANMGFGIPIGR